MGCGVFASGKFGPNVYLSNCPCPSRFPYPSPEFIAGGSIVKMCGDAPFAPGIVNGKTGDVATYPTQTVDENYPYKILGQVSRADQKANVFSKAFNPANRKIIVLMIAGFLLFLAAINYD